MMRVCRAALVALLLSVTGIAVAHEVRPAFLKISDVSATAGAQSYEVLWRVPTGAPVPLLIDVQLPEDCSPISEKLSWESASVEHDRWTVRCAGGLTGRRVEIAGLTASVTDVLVRYERADGTTQVVRLTPTRPSFVVTAAESTLEVIATYTWLGVEHILLGIDHLLFVLALLMIVAGWRLLIATVTSFTLAHSITLAAATLGWVSVPQSPVEAVIALSILFVCMEIVHWRDGRPGAARRWPWIVAFVFGLLHGFGFAGALSEIGLPENEIPLALLFFNVGVELGQLAFIAAVFALWAVAGRLRINWPEWAWRVPVYAIGSLAAFWTIERIAKFI
jgi:hydrogenase/urease accessory protein HupE